MSLEDWLIDLALIGLVVVQLRGRPLNARALLLPVVLVVWAGAKYLDGVPTAGNDLLLIVPAVLAGLALGAGAGLLARVYRRDADGVLVARATVAAAALWVLGMGCRLAFQLYATQGGGRSIGTFSARHHLDLAAWTSALLLMAFAEVFARTALLGWRGYGVFRGPAREGGRERELSV